MHPIIDWHVGYQERIDALQATNVVPILIGKRAPLMMGVNAADTAKVVFCYPGVELVQPKIFFPLDNTNPVQGDRCNDRAFTAADRAIAAPRIDDALWEFEHQHYAAAVTHQPMLGLNGNATNLPDTHMIASIDKPMNSIEPKVGSDGYSQAYSSHDEWKTVRVRVKDRLCSRGQRKRKQMRIDGTSMEL